MTNILTDDDKLITYEWLCKKYKQYNDSHYRYDFIFDDRCYANEALVLYEHYNKEYWVLEFINLETEEHLARVAKVKTQGTLRQLLILLEIKEI